MYGRYRLQKKVLSMPYYSEDVINVALNMCNWYSVDISFRQE